MVEIHGSSLFLSISLFLGAIILIGGSIALGVYFIVKATQPRSIQKTKQSLKNVNTVNTPSKQPSNHKRESKIVDNKSEEIKINQGIILFMEYHSGQFLLNAINPQVEINSRVYNIKWGANQINLDSGQYSLKAYYPYMGMAQCGSGYIDFTLDKNEVKKMRYTGPLTIFQDAKIELIEF